MNVTKTKLGLIHITDYGWIDADDVSVYASHVPILDILVTNEEAKELINKLLPLIEQSPYTKQLEEA